MSKKMVTHMRRFGKRVGRNGVPNGSTSGATTIYTFVFAVFVLLLIAAGVYGRAFITIPALKQAIIHKTELVHERIDNVVSSRAAAVSAGMSTLDLSKAPASPQLEKFNKTLQLSLPDFLSLELLNDQGELSAMMGELSLNQTGVAAARGDKFIQMFGEAPQDTGYLIDDEPSRAFYIVSRHVGPDRKSWFTRTKFSRQAIEQALAGAPEYTANLVTPLVPNLDKNSFKREAAKVTSQYGWFSAPISAEMTLGYPGVILTLNKKEGDSAIKDPVLYFPLLLSLLVVIIGLIVTMANNGGQTPDADFQADSNGPVISENEQIAIEKSGKTRVERIFKEAPEPEPPAPYVPMELTETNEDEPEERALNMKREDLTHEVDDSSIESAGNESNIYRDEFFQTYNDTDSAMDDFMPINGVRYGFIEDEEDSTTTGSVASYTPEPTSTPDQSPTLFTEMGNPDDYFGGVVTSAFAVQELHNESFTDETSNSNEAPSKTSSLERESAPAEADEIHLMPDHFGSGPKIQDVEIAPTPQSNEHNQQVALPSSEHSINLPAVDNNETKLLEMGPSQFMDEFDADELDSVYAINAADEYLGEHSAFPWESEEIPYDLTEVAGIESPAPEFLSEIESLELSCDFTDLIIEFDEPGEEEISAKLDPQSGFEEFPEEIEIDELVRCNETVDESGADYIEIDSKYFVPDHLANSDDYEHQLLCNPKITIDSETIKLAAHAVSDSISIQDTCKHYDVDQKIEDMEIEWECDAVDGPILTDPDKICVSPITIEDQPPEHMAVTIQPNDAKNLMAKPPFRSVEFPEIIELEWIEQDNRLETEEKDQQPKDVVRFSEFFTF